MTKAKEKNTREIEKKPASSKKELILQETEDDLIFGKSFKSDPDDFTADLIKQAQKTGIMTFLIPLFVFLLIAGVSAGLTYYYAKPERSIEASVRAEDKIQNLPAVNTEEPKNTTPDAPVSNPAPVTPAEPTTKTTDISYVVKEGDTMSGIANKYDMTSAELAKYNGITDVNSLRIGQTIKIPSK